MRGNVNSNDADPLKTKLGTTDSSGVTAVSLPSTHNIRYLSLSSIRWMDLQQRVRFFVIDN